MHALSKLALRSSRAPNRPALHVADDIDSRISHHNEDNHGDTESKNG
jgi:hypothetical protein